MGVLVYWPLNLSYRLPLLLATPAQNFGELNSPYSIPSPRPLKCTLVQKRKDSFFKETKEFISNIK